MTAQLTPEHHAAQPTTNMIGSRPEPGAPEQRVQTSGVRIGDLLAVVGALIASYALTRVVGTQIAPLHGFLASFLVMYVLFLALYALLVSLDESGPVVRDRVVSVAVQSGAFLMIIALASVVVYTIGRGAGAVWHWNLFTQDMSVTHPLDPLTQGGVWHGIVGTLIEISIALCITVPLGITTAVFLNEVPGSFARFVRTIVEAMTALPSIVAGLFILSLAIIELGLEKSGLAAALAISVEMLPIMIRASDVVLRLVPATLKEASLGLGASQFRTVLNVVLPTSRSGLTTAIILATARGLGETSPVLLTAGFAAGANYDPVHGPMTSLPLAVLEFVKNPTQNMIDRGFGTAVVLIVLVLILFALARHFGSQTVAKKVARKQRRTRRLQRLKATLARVKSPSRPRAATRGARARPRSNDA